MGMSVRRRIFEGTFFISTATLFARAGTFLANVAIIRTLSQESVGRLGLLESWLTLIGMVAGLGVSVAVTKYVPHYLEADRTRVGSLVSNSILLTLLASITVVVIGWLGFNTGWLGTAGRVYDVLTVYSMWFAGLVLTTSFKQILSAIHYGFQSFQVLIVPNIVVGLLSFPATFFLVKSRSLHGALEARILLTLIESVLLLHAVLVIGRRLNIRFSTHGFARDCRQLLGFGLPNFIGQLGVSPVHAGLLSFLAEQPAGLNQLALLTAANRLCALANFLPGSMAATLIPVLAGEWGKGKVENFREGTRSAMRMLGIVNLPIILFFLALSPQLLNLLFGATYRDAGPLAFVLLLVVFLACLNETADRSLAAAGRVWLSTANNFLWALGFIGLAAWLVPKYLSRGYVGAYFISFAAYVVWQLWWMRRLFQTDLRNLTPLLWLSLTLVALSSLIAILPDLALQIVLTGVLISSCLLLLWTKVLTNAERQALLNQRARLFGAAGGWFRDLRGGKP
ncbi:MAG TPA: oligosaccharide flippase family protein [Candidatus Eisenbacteria bacterium]|nr:oligosaccharide flippase family protein [Candidatus Eisenbacteria bacterium]